VAFLLLKYAIKDFLEDQKFKNLSKYTLENYSLNLKEFQEFCTNHQIVDTSDIQPALSLYQKRKTEQSGSS
jgi:integrase/recombinase XerD